ncbi:gamma-glutamyltransferase family protein [Alteribacter natronophilus]|uniref:gamma-glutamyltransferase family protein n=1 Tax=Alteribacter natronophilus TaxID=2583810 RepID=UPI00110ECED1|nr:gamma-glutamyltransferase family protein [Alteribacter natronophilus]TMW72232.1 gamma-glutamyltransferase family protein [Alteribacter natronophilus]
MPIITLGKKPVIVTAIIILLGIGGALYMYPASLQSGSEAVPSFQEDRENDEAAETEKEELAPIPNSVSSDHPLATEIGLDVLEEGGNAVDAAVAISYALGTIEPYASGIGGDGVMLVQERGSEPVTYDYRAMAPVSGSSHDNGVGIPGFVAGMETVHGDYGELDLEDLIEPSITLAEEGVEIDGILERRLSNAAYRLPVHDLPLFFINRIPISAGETLVQEELADTLRVISDHGAESFYKGEIAEAVAEDVPGLTIEDLASYEVKKHATLQGSFHGLDVHVPSGASSGTMLIQSLQLAELLEAEQYLDDDAAFAHLMGQINRRSHKDRTDYVGDPSFVDVPHDMLTSMERSRELAETLADGSLGEEYRTEMKTQADREEHNNTTHITVVDEDGTMVSVTNTLSNFFGSGVYTHGFFMNNQMHNFTDSESSPNREEPGKRPNSHMVPAILSHNGSPVIGLGSAGGRRIPSVITQTLVRSVAGHEPVQDAIDAPRTYLDVFEETLLMESDEGVEELRSKGYTVDHSRNSPFNFGSVNVIVADHENGRVIGGADERRNGSFESR